MDANAKRRVASTRHGHTWTGGKSPTYQSWENMIARCTRPSNPAYRYYKAQGIKVCARWRKFKNFLADMGERPHGATLDRFPDRRGDYRPGNCRWASKIEQANNRVTNARFEYRGRSYTLAELARATDVPKELLRSRLLRSGRKWTVAGAVDTPALPKGSHFCC